MDGLRTLLGGCLHPDFGEDYATVWDAIADFRTPYDAVVEDAHHELVELLSRHLDEPTLLDLMGSDTYMCEYWPPGEGMTATQFLTLLEVELRPPSSTQ